MSNPKPEGVGVGAEVAQKGSMSFNYGLNASICDEARTVAASLVRIYGWNEVDAYNAVLQGVAIGRKMKLEEGRQS